MMFFGCNVAGGDVDYGVANTTNPTSGSDFLFVSHQDIDYLAAKKVNFVRLLISWECLQQSLNSPLANNSYNTTLQDRVAYFTSKGINVMLEIHGASDKNFAKYKGNLVGTAAVPNSAFADFWSRMATQYKNNPNVIIGLTNEPHDMSTVQWFSAAQAAITAIRATGFSNYIFVPGNGWTGASTWSDTNVDTATPKVSNATAWKTLSDPLNKLVASVHMYFDANNGGGSTDVVNANIGVTRVTAIVNWAKANNVKIHLSEFAASSTNATAPTAVKNLLDYLVANSDVVLGATWWAYGPPTWWGNYQFTLCPKNNYTTDDPKWAWLAPYLTTATPTPVPTPSPYLPVTYDSNGFFHLNSGKSDYVGYKPDTYNSTKPTSLFVWMHGCGGNAEGDMWSICPPATRKTQSYIGISLGGRDGACWSMATDMPKVLAAITDMSKYFNIDPKRIYLGGYSSGGDMTYYVGMQNAGLFAGLLIENSSAWGSGLTVAQLIAKATWKINIAQLNHLSDTTYPIAKARTDLTALKNAGFPVSAVEKAGTHYDADSGTTGTNYDLIHSLLPFLDAGWTLPGTTPVPNPTPVPTPAGQFRGANLTGGGAQGTWEKWQGANVATRSPGQGPRLGVDFTFVTPADIDYCISKGMNTFRLLFSHEAIQPQANAAIPYAGNLVNPTRYSDYYAAFKSLVDYITITKGATCLIDVHNAEGTFPTGFTSYYLRQFSMTPTSAQESGNTLANLWGQLATKFLGNSKVWFGIQNEPTTSIAQWYPVAQACINAIRATGNTNTICMPGWNADGAWTWTSQGNDAAFAALTDPANNLIVQVHTYYDQNNSGNAEILPNTTYQPDMVNGVPATKDNIGQARLAAATTWARANGKKIFIGELALDTKDVNGVDQTAQMTRTWRNTVDFINLNSDVLIGYAWWEYGSPGWSGNTFDLRPVNGVDNARMNVIKGDFVGIPVPPPPPPPPPPPTVANIAKTSTTVKYPGGQGFSAKKVVGDGYVNAPAGTYTLSFQTVVTYSGNSSFCVDIIVTNDNPDYDLSWDSLKLDLRGHTLASSGGCVVAGTTGIVTVVPNNKTVLSKNKAAFNLCLTRATDATSYYQVLVKSVTW